MTIVDQRVLILSRVLRYYKCHKFMLAEVLVLLGVTRNICDTHKRVFFVFQTTINSYSFYESTISPSWKYLDSSCTNGEPHNYIK